MTLFTIGFTKTTAEHFFTRLKDAGVKWLIDVRLNNRSQPAGFAKQQDLEYFLREIADIDCIYRPEWAPTQDILDAHKKSRGRWDVYEVAFKKLIDDRRLVAEYLQKKFEGLEICHLQSI